MRGWAYKRSHGANLDGLRGQVLELVREECGGGAGDGFGSTLVAEHLASDHQVRVGVSTLQEWMPQPPDRRLSGKVAPERKRFDSRSEPPVKWTVRRLMGAIDPRLIWNTSLARGVRVLRVVHFVSACKPESRRLPTI